MSLDYLMDSELISPMQSSKSITHLMSKDKRLDQIELPSETDHTEIETSQPKITMRFKPLDELEGKHWYIIILNNLLCRKRRRF